MNFFGIFTFSSVMIFVVMVFIVITVIRNFSKSAFGTPDLTKVLEQDAFKDEGPRSLNGMDAVYMPQILADFPDFNPSLAKSKVKAKLRETLKNKSELAIHNVVISGYDRGSVEKTIRYQAALQYKKQNGVTVQKRYNLSYTFMLSTGDGTTLAANCPNCGGAISSSSQKVCEYCDSRLVNVMGNSWEFTEVYES